MPGEFDDIIQKTIETIVSVAEPLRIILFGSAARGEMGPNSDLDLLVVVRNGCHRRKTAQKIYRRLIDVGFATDIIVVTEEDLERFGSDPGMVIKKALDEGRELYAA